MLGGITIYCNLVLSTEFLLQTGYSKKFPDLIFRAQLLCHPQKLWSGQRMSYLLLDPCICTKISGITTGKTLQVA